ncbi:MAG: hypothetical protein KGQ59_03950 [Bdellovibrionales bacterium]|nr:hypothetical protein [Bdellovibrionales bacterium]
MRSIANSIIGYSVVFSIALSLASSPVWSKETKPSNTETTIKGAVKFGSNFSYGPASSFDLSFKEDAKISRGPHKIENVAELYSYYWGGPDGPVQRLKDKRKLEIKYLYNLLQSWSPFVGYEFRQETSLKNGSDFVKKSQNADLGLRFEQEFANFIYLQLESGYRQAYEKTSTSPNVGVPKLRDFASLYFYAGGLNWGLWANHLAPFDDLSDYVIDFGPDLSYNLPGTSFYLGLTASATLVPQPLYEGDTRFKVWSGSFYGGFKF